MSFKVSNIVQLPQPVVHNILHDETEIGVKGYQFPTLGGVFSDTRYIWQAKGPALEIKDIETGVKVGAWTFGCILKDYNAKVVCVDEIQRPNSKIPLLVIGIECGISGSMICIFEVFGSKIIRAIQISEKITSLHIVDSGHEVLNLPGPLRNFDGIIAIGTEGGNVYLIDMCRQICEEALYSMVLRDELFPCQLVFLTSKDISKIEYYKERSVREGDHLAIHINVVLDSLTEHFTLKGPKGEDKIHVNRDEVLTSALYYCPQLTSLLVGFNFGAFQMWDLTTLKLIYTSPICEEHLPITHFALQEPADDPRAFCYIWAIYSNTELFQTGLPIAVMYSLCYDSKEYHEGYGFLYQDFQMCSVRFQTELGPLDDHRGISKVKGGRCIAVNAIYKTPTNKDLYSHDSTGDTLALCVISWTLWYQQHDTQTCTLLFDLNQWYKEQMPELAKSASSSNYILKINVSDLTTMNGRKAGPFLDIKINKKSLRQFLGVQKLEEHFCPSALSFDLWGLRENDIMLIHSEGLQRALLSQIEAAGPLCLLRPNDIYRQVIALGMIPLFTDLSLNMSVAADVQREVILNVSLEHQLISWLCSCASEWANGSFSSAGCSLDFLIYWAFQRAVVLKSNCDKYCMPLFDYSQSRLDNNTSILLNNCIKQINSLCTFYSYVINKLHGFISNPELALEQHTSLKMVSTYFEVLQWLVNVGLLPECHPSTYPRSRLEKISAPYPVKQLTDYYNEKRARLQLLSKDSFVSSDSLLFIDNLINNKCGANHLQKQWQEDGGSGLYPPPSLQSMLRTYLVEGADISHKHSLVIYVFLDLAMALDQSQYASVITHLIKFPAVFKVSSSVIKITQAFWQLDHGDYTTAMEQLLDPFVLADDLESWHHAIAMRALLLQNHYNYALLYMQVRKPPIRDEKDIFTAISLFIANGMLDEAFYFKNQHCSNNDEKLLMHLFNECNKNDSLHVLLYRSMNSNEEKAFLKYLRSIENPTADDLQVFYFLLRSRFVEAFDTHDTSKRKNPDTQGLLGQRNASKTDQIVRIFKMLLPDVNRNLVEVVRKERTNLWKEVARPTPMSVFVHNTNEQIRYKSTLIHAALSKAKSTFDNSINSSKFKDIFTEETPFLRTPRAYRIKPRQNTPVITPKMIEIDESGEELGPTPSKRLKLTPRASTTSPTYTKDISIHSKMLTPIVKRKTSIQKDQSSLINSNVCTPQSILKVRNLVRNNEETIELEPCEELARTDLSPRKSTFSLQPRKSLSRISRPQVKFDDAANFSSSFSDQSNKQCMNNTSFEEKSTLSSKDISLMVSSKNSSSSNTDEVFYSPNSSLSKSQEESNITENSEMKEVVVEPTIEFNELESKHDESETQKITQSPKARRSYKRSLRESTPIRSSPRLTKTVTDDERAAVSDSLQNIAEGSPSTPLMNKSTLNVPALNVRQSPRTLQKVKGRKSLSRTVLEHNTFSKSLTPQRDNIVSKETSISKTDRITTIKNLDTSETSTVESKEVISTISFSKVATPDGRQERHMHDTRSFYKKKVLESPYLDSDTSMESNIFLDSPEVPERLKLSDSLLDYIKSRGSKIENQSMNDSSDVTLETSKISSQTTDSDEILLVQGENKTSEIFSDKQLEQTVQVDSKVSDDNKSEVEFMEVYEDLSSGAEDIEEVLSGSKHDTSASKIYTELSNYCEDTYNELEKNIFNLTESKEPSFEDEIVQIQHHSVSTISKPSSQSFDVSEAEKGFLCDDTNTDISSVNIDKSSTKIDTPTVDDERSSNPTNPEVIEISSSSENASNASNTSSSSSVSKSREKSESDNDKLNISYERNHAEDSESSAGSQYSRATAENASESDREDRELIELREENNRDLSENSNASLEVNEDGSSEWLNKQRLEGDRSDAEAFTNVGDALNVDDALIVENVDIVVEVNDEMLVVQEEVEMTVESNQNESHVIRETVSMQYEQQTEALEPQLTADRTVSQDDEKKPSAPEHTPQASQVCEQGEKSPENNASRGSPVSHTETVKETLSNIEPIKQDTFTENQEKKSVQTQKSERSDTEEKGSNTTKIVLDKTLSVQVEDIGKKNQGTNTTLFLSAGNYPEEGTHKVEQSTNTTVCVPKVSSIKNTSVVEVERPKDRRVYHPKYGTMKLVTGDQTLSSVSSDTTESDISRQEIVVTAQVHTPIRKKADTSSGMRLTRRSSVLSETSQAEGSGSVGESNTENASTGDIMDEDYQHTIHHTPKKAYTTDILEDTNLLSTTATDKSNIVLTPGRRTRRSMSATLTPLSSIKTRRSLQIEEEDKHNQPSVSKEIKKQEPSRMTRKSRSASVDEINPQLKKVSLRSNSVDNKSEDSFKEKKTKGRGKATSTSQLPSICEETKESTTTGRKSKTESLLETYATSRRLTRRQASLVRGMETPSTVTAQDDSDTEKDLDIDVIDPIKLLDKEPFEGKPDPDEEKVYEPSSPSNSTVSSFNRPAKRTSRSTSITSDCSLPPSVSQASTPKRRTRRSLGPTECPSSSGVTTRSRKQSETSSITSEKSESSTPPKKQKTMDPEESSSVASDTNSTRKTRRRANSTSSVKSDKSTSPKRTTRSRRLVSAKSDLPGITEEKGTEAGDVGVKPNKRSTRKKSSQ